VPNHHVPAAATGLPNRRFFLAAGPAAAVFGAVSAAAASTMPASSSKGVIGLQRLIDAHRETEEIAGDAAEQREKAGKLYRKMVEKIDFRTVCNEHWRFDEKDPAKSREVLFDLLRLDRQSLNDSMCHMGLTMKRRFDQLWAEYLDQKGAQFDAVAAKVEAVRRQSGLAEAERAVEETFAASDAIYLRICAWPCATIEEIRLRAAYFEETCEPESDDEIAALLRSLAGHPGVEG
jgi:hypothetical protein